ncbi:hypothetical protein Tco_0139405 [Tanacetum coccineum]
MSTSTTHQQSLVDAGSETRPPMLERAMWQRVERLMRGTVQNKVDRETHFNNEFDQFVSEPGEALVSVYNRFAQLMNDLEQNGIKFPRVTVNTKFLNCLQPEWIKYVTQVRLAKRAKKLEKSHDPLTLVAHTGSSSRNPSPYYVTHPSSVADYDDDYQGDDEAGVTLTDEQNDFLIVDVTQMEEIEELRPSYDSAFLSKVQNPSTSFVNPLFAKDNQEQKYPKQPKIINNTIGDDQIDNNIIFDEPNVDVNSGSVECDNNVQASFELEQLARNAYKEAEK